MKITVNGIQTGKLTVKDVKEGQIFSCKSSPHDYYLVPFPCYKNANIDRKLSLLKVLSGEHRNKGHIVISLKEKSLGWIGYESEITGVYELVEGTLNRVL